MHRTGPSLQVADPTPATVFDLTWSFGARRAAADRLALTLTDVDAVTVDADRARLSCPTVSVTSDGPTTVRFTSLHPNALVTGGTARARTDRNGDVAVGVRAGKSTVTVCATATGRGEPAAPVASGEDKVDGSTGALATTGAGSALPVTALVLLTAAGIAVRWRRRLP